MKQRQGSPLSRSLAEAKGMIGSCKTLSLQVKWGRKAHAVCGEVAQTEEPPLSAAKAPVQLVKWTDFTMMHTYIQ